MRIEADNGQYTMEVFESTEAAAALKIASRRAAFELKGVMTSLAVLRLGTVDLALIERQLRIKIAQLPQFFQDAPVVLDLGAMPDGGAGVKLRDLVALLRGYHLIPIAITNAGDRMRAIAVAVGLGVMPDRPRSAGPSVTVPAGPSTAQPAAGGDSINVTTRGVEVAPASTGRSARAQAANGGAGRAPGLAELPAHRPPLVVRQPVRGGQVIYAQRSDLVVLAPVNPGAEVVADGHVHIYSTLRGKAVAGAQGFGEARIFCQRLDAELVAVAGAYVMADDIPPERRGRAAQIYLEGGECRIGAL